MVVGREKERAILHKMLETDSSELLAVYGRRRVGKTFLIREMYNKRMAFQLTGIYGGNRKDQLANFHAQLQSSSVKFKNTKPPKDWFDAFRQLEKYLDGLKGKKKKVIFIDEFPWVETKRSKFLNMFEHFWNTYCTQRKDLVVVVCGSAASFMVNNIIKNKGGLHNRLSQVIRLMPFNLNEVELFLRWKKINLNHYNILQLYMAFGGVPFYLDKIARGESVAQNIDRLCFENGSLFQNEFNEVFSSLFSNSHIHQTVIRALSKSKKGVTRKVLLKACKLESSGVFTKTLVELIESGFVSEYYPFGKRNKDKLFRLSDEYSLFYLKFIEPNLGQGTGTWTKLFPKQTYKSWTGFVFETICLKHIDQIKIELGINKIYSINSSWVNANAQVDLVIDRDDGIINLCEIKYCKDEFVISKQVYENVRNKISEFSNSTKTRKNISVTWVTTFGVIKNGNALELVENDLTMDCLFAARS